MGVITWLSILEVLEVGGHLWVGCSMPFMKEQEVDFFFPFKELCVGVENRFFLPF